MRLRNWETVGVSSTGWTIHMGYHFTYWGALGSASILNADMRPGIGGEFRVIVRKRVS